METEICSIVINKNKQEIAQRGTPLFPCSIYKRDIGRHAGGDIPPHWHHELELFMLDEGRARLVFIDAEYDIEAGEGVFINSDVLHGIYNITQEKCRYHSVVFDPSIVSGAPGSAFDVLYLRPLMESGAPARLIKFGGGAETDEANGRIAEFFERGFSACEEKFDGYEFAARENFSKMLLLLKNSMEGAAGKAKKQKKTYTQQELYLKQMISWINENFSEEVTADKIASAAGLCVRECQKIFSRFLRMTPMQYLARQRISKAAELLTSTGRAVGDIAVSCGFESHSYFAKQFKSIVGMPPGEYRRIYGG